MRWGAERLRSTNSSRNAGTRRSGEPDRSRKLCSCDFERKHSPMPLSGVVWLREAVECYASGKPEPTPLLLCLFRVARIGETRGLACYPRTPVRPRTCPPRERLCTLCPETPPTSHPHCPSPIEPDRRVQ